MRAQGAALVTLNHDTVVDGNIQVWQSKSATLDRVWVGRTLQLESNDSALTVTRNRVAGDMRATGNRAGVVVRNNSVNGVLHCSTGWFQPLVEANRAGVSQIGHSVHSQGLPAGRRPIAATHRNRRRSSVHVDIHYVDMHKPSW
ncbi:MAG: hypothetical protein NZ553_19810 [Caldilinea sp.]|nr:hypothetical protein [Caldilinea sp.]MDW8442730.1 hypothetical protein [Caldilineaceae bacterium]